MTIRFDTHGTAEIARLPATLVLANAAQIRALLQARIGAGSARLVLDLSQVEFADSSGLSAILSCAPAARRSGGDVALLSPTPRVRALVELTRLDDVMAVVTDANEALARIGARNAA